MNLWTLSFIVLVSLVNNWLVQLAYYIYSIRKNPAQFAGQKTLLDYWTGVVGDGVLAPLLNVFIYIVIVKLSIKLSLSLIGWSYAMALIMDVLIHWYQGKMRLTNWSMPKPYQWNVAGRWHMVSFPIQVAYLLIYIYILITYFDRIILSPDLLISVTVTFALSVLFLYFFWVDYRR